MTISPASAASPELGTIAVLTCNRPDALRRALSSYAAASPTAALHVFDDSRDETFAARNQQIAAEVSRTYGVTVAYSGVEERQRVTDTLVATGLPPQSVRFALAAGETPPISVGANRNAVLLGLADRLALCVDDDTICTMAAPPSAVPDLRLLHTTNETVDPIAPCELWTFPDRAALEHAVAFTAADPLADHRPLLGRPAGDCIADAVANGRYVENVNDAWRADRATIAVTLNGCAGDSGWQTPAAYLLVAGRSFARLTASEPHYRRTLLMREVLKVAPATTIADACPNLMAGFMGIDGRQLLPPFPPEGRGEDALFGILLGGCCPDLRIAHVPVALLHSPLQPRAFAANDIVRGALGVDLFTVLASCVSTIVAGGLGGDSAARMVQLGVELEGIGRTPAAAAVRIVRQAVARTVSRRIAALDIAIAAAGGAAPFWREDARTVIGVAGQLLGQEHFWLPADYLDAGPAEASRRVLSYLRNVGSMLQVWPALVDANRSMRRTARFEQTFQDGRRLVP